MAFLTKIIKKMEPSPIQSKVYKIMEDRAEDVYKRIGSHITPGKVLDIGVGVGVVMHQLKQKNIDITGIDVKDLSVYPDAKPIIYDGNTLPFEDNAFDTSLLIYVLHHCTDHLKVLDEAMRVSKRVIVMEDTYPNPLSHLAVSVVDSISNWEFRYHPIHKSSWWKEYLDKKNYKLLHMEEWASLDYGFLPGNDLLMVLEKKVYTNQQ